MNESQAECPPAPSAPEGVLDRALALVEFLRSRCPWDAAQTPRSLRRYLLEEAHEVVDAVDSGDAAALRDELGDLLLNLAFQIVIAEEREDFDRHAVAAGLEAKMRRRHPHLYGDGEAEAWEVLKARERGVNAPADPAGVLNGLEPTADALRDAQRIQDRVAAVGFDWPDAAGAFDKLEEEMAEVGAELAGGDDAALEEEIGDLLFSVVNVARRSAVDAPTALRRANAKFTRRFRAVERLAWERRIDIHQAGLDVLDGLWDEAKRSGA